MNSAVFIKVVFAPLGLVGLYLLVRLAIPGPPGVELAVLAVLCGLWLFVRTVRRERS